MENRVVYRLGCAAFLAVCTPCLPAAAQGSDSHVAVAPGSPNTAPAKPAAHSGERGTPVVQKSGVAGSPNPAQPGAEPGASMQSGVPAQPPVVCVAGLGIDDESAETAVALVCDELRKQGVAAVTTASAQGALEAYRVNLRRLGTDIYLELSREKPVGQVVDSKRIQLSSIEQASWASGRLAKAMVEGVAVDDTASSSTLVGEETRTPQKRNTKTRFSLGVLGTLVGDQAGYGIDMGLGFASEEYGAHILARLSAGDATHTALVLAAWRYLYDGEVAPLVGIGAGIAHLAYHDSDTGADWSNSGFILEPTFGVEVFRFEKSRLQIMATVDFPVFKFKRDDSTDSKYGLGGTLSLGYLF